MYFHTEDDILIRNPQSHKSILDYACASLCYLLRMHGYEIVKHGNTRKILVDHVVLRDRRG